MNLVVTVPKWFWREWIAEGDAAGEPYSGEEWGFFLGGNKPPIGPGDRLYIVAHNRLRGYAPVTRLGSSNGKWVICREGGGVAVTIDETIKGFQGFRKVWWKESEEKPFPEWKTADVGTNPGINAETQRTQSPDEKPIEQKVTEGTKTVINTDFEQLTQQIAGAIAKYRMTYDNEGQLQFFISKIFKAEGIAFEREVIISPRERLDFFIGRSEMGDGSSGDGNGSVPAVAGPAENGAARQHRPTGFAVEVKIGGAVDGHLRQMKRYNEHPRVAGTILISTRRYDLPESLSGKPIAGINIGGNRL